MHESNYDSMDLRLLDCLQGEARLSNVELSERVHLSPSQCLRRFGVVAFVNVSLEKQSEHPAQAFNQAVQDLPEILECHAVSGEADYLLRVVTADLKAFSDFLMHRLLRLPMVAHVRSSILLDEVKSTTALPLGHL
jgi:Lrp/AsnC family leucine-responsive transcriptional regulator